jgi:uncharacterized membrane protein
VDEKETGRLEAFSDGVFAVAITLLVLNVKVPGLDLPSSQLPIDSNLWTMLRNEWPMVFAYVTSFLTIGVMWVNHHRLFVHIKRIDSVLLFINLLLLLTIVFLPVPTALLAEYIVLPAQHLAAVVYSGTCVLIACFYNILWRYASYHHRLLQKDADAKAVDAISKQYLFGPLVYLIAFGIAWKNLPVSVACVFIIALFFGLPGRIISVPFARKTLITSTVPSASEQIEELEL